MSVRFKFKNDLDYQPIPCDGFHISVRDLKKSIIRSKKFGKVTDFDLVVTNSQTNHIYLDDNELISKNTTLTVQRAPLGEGKKKVWEEETSVSASIALASHTTTFAGIPGLNLTQNNLDSEDDKISKMMSNSSEMYSEKHWTKFKGQRALPDGAKPPPHWKCSKCLANHWVSDCPFANNDMKRTTGIPRSFLKPAESNVPGAKINPQGLIVVNEMEKQAYSEKKVEKNPWLQEDEKPVVAKGLVPTELLCPICKDLLKDAVMMPCCAGSACDECARNGIIDSEGSRCPVCSDVANPEELIPYRLFRDKVDKFRNQTGYTKATRPPPTQLTGKPTLPDIVLPDPADLNFKFDALVGHRAAPGVKVEPPNLNFTLNPTTNGSPSLPDLATSNTPHTDSPHETPSSRQQVSPHTPTSTPPRSPGTPTSSPHRSRSRSQSRKSRSPGTPISPRNESRGRDTPTPTTSPQHAQAPLVDTSIPPPLYTGAPGPTLLPPGHVLAPSSHYPPPPPALAPAPVYYHQPTVINPAEDPLAAFEAAMRKLDSKKADRGRLGPSSPPRAYRVERPRSRSRGRYRDYRDRDYSPHRRSPGAYRGHSPRRGLSPRRVDRGRSRGSGPRTPSPYSNGDSRTSLLREGRTASPGTARDYRGDSHGSMGTKRKERYVTDIPPETEDERRDRERFERDLADRERYGHEPDKEDQYSNYKKNERSKGRVAPTPPREFLEGDKTNSYREKDPDNRTPSLSPEPGTEQHEEYMRRKEQRQREEREADVRIKQEGVSYRDDKSHPPRDDEKANKKSNDEKCEDNSKSKERSIDKTREKDRESSREVWGKDQERTHDSRGYDSRDRDVRDTRDKDVRDFRDRDVRDVKESRDKDVRDSRDRDVRDSRDKDIREFRDRDTDVRESRDKDARDSRDRDIREYRDRDVRDHRSRDVRESRDRDVRDRNRYYDGEDWDRSRERGRERSREVRDRSRDRSRERKDGSRDRRERSKENYREDNFADERNGHKEASEERIDDRDHNEKKEPKKEKKAKKSKKKSKKKDKDSDEDEDGKENKESKKKKKKGKKKKDKDPESNDEDNQEEDIKPLVPYGENEDVKTTEESSENQEEKQPADPTKFINSFSEAKADETKPKLNLPTLVFNDKTVELAPKENPGSEVDVNNDLTLMIKNEVLASEKKADIEKYDKITESKSKADLPRGRNEAKLQEKEQETVANVVSKWDREDVLTTEYPKRESSHVKAELASEYHEFAEDSKTNVLNQSSGPQNVLRKALANMEKDNIVRDKKRKSIEGSETDNDNVNSKKKKKKKKKKVETEEESSEEESKEKPKKKNKKKKKGGLEIPEKTLKKLLKKNLLKKKALEKLISSEGKKKKKKNKEVDDSSDLTNKESSPAEKHTKKDSEEGRSRKKSKSREKKNKLKSEERIVRRRESHSGERRAGKGGSEERRSVRRGTKGDTSEDEREVKSSREGLIQVRLDNSSSRLGSTLGSSRSSLTSTVQANLLKLAGQVDSGRKREERNREPDRQRESPPRKSIKDRLGPLSGGDTSPTKKCDSRDKVDRLDRNTSRVGEDRLVRRTAALVAVKDRLGGSKDRAGKDRVEREESGPKQEARSARERLGAVPADLQAWALKATSQPSNNSDRRDRKKSESLNLSSDEEKKIVKRRRSISRERGSNSREQKRNNSKERRRSPSREIRRDSPSQERKSKKEKKKEKRRTPEPSPVKKRRNHRLTNEVDRSFNSDSD